MAAYYNEIDPQAAQWLRNLIAAGHIAPGDVDERSIKDVQAHELAGYTQCHFFAGIGVWSYALRGAGWPDDRPVWTGSCPCQPFSAAGKGEGLDDPRHLWPDWFRLIRERGPVVVFGEQVAGPDGIAWLDLAQADLEEHSHTVGAVVTCSAGFGGSDIRQRLYWVADAGSGRAERHGLALAGEAGGSEGEGDQRQRLRADAGDGGDIGGLAHADEGQRGSRRDGPRGPAGSHAESAGRGSAGRMGDATIAGRQGRSEQDVPGAGRGSEGRGPAGPGATPCGLADSGHDGWPARSPRREHEPQASIGEEPGGDRADSGAGPLNGFWRAADWLHCTDGKWRPVEPGTFPLDTGTPGRVGRLRAYGNALNAEVAREFIAAYMNTRHQRGGN